jgi:hypothetical protein
MPDNATLDPSRLVHLARVRDQRRAVAKDIYDRYQENREKRISLQRLLDVAAESYSSKKAYSRFPEETASNVAQLKAQLAEFSAAMAKLQDEGDAASAEANEAATLFSRCLAFALDAKLEIPPSLKSEVSDLLSELRGRSGAPLFVV